MPRYDREQLDRWRKEDAGTNLLARLWAWWPAILLPALILLATIVKLWGMR